MRHPSFKGLRVDKDPKDVRRELPAKERKTHSGTKSWRSNRREGTTSPYGQAASRVAEAAPSKLNKNADRRKEAKEGGNPGAASADSKSMASKALSLAIGRHTVKISNPDKLWWPEEGIAKQEIVEYYQNVSPYILPYLKDRPENLLRNPNGITRPAFFHKDMREGLPGWARTEEIYSESNDRTLHYLVCNDAATLAYMNNLGCIEINPWNSRIQSLDKPDYIVIDLDPAANTFEQVIEVAQAVKQVLDKAGIVGYPKTSGSSGIHIYIPMAAKYTYEQAGQFARILAQLTHKLLPGLTSLDRAVVKRKKLIYLDYLQNREGQTLASVYSVRPKPGATVSTPLEWGEVKNGLHPSQFHIRNILDRLEKKGDLFTPVLGKGVDIAKALKTLAG
jgi:bifunctional non-homologous end joining protein LigD